MLERMCGPAVGRIRERLESHIIQRQGEWSTGIWGLLERRKKNIMVCDSLCISPNIDYHIAPPLHLRLGLEKRILSLGDTSWDLLRWDELREGVL